jgi:uncharacterized repeat protein (TIGR03803 family)
MYTLGSFTGANGANPQAGLVSNWDGNLYGTTFYGGSNGLGTVFQVTGAGAVNMIASFSNSVGVSPWGLISVNSNLVGTTYYGGSNDLGTVFCVNTSGTIWTVANFNEANGSNPNSPLLLAADGNIYGTAFQGGTGRAGVVFKLSTNATGGTNGVTWTNSATTQGLGGLRTNVSTMTNIVTFGGTNGANPEAGLIQGADYELYGTTASGSSNGYGSIFKFQFPLTITAQPVSVDFGYGSNAVFTVKATASGSATGAGLHYQWQWNGTNITTNKYPSGVEFSGWTSSNLTILNEDIYDAGTYTVVVSNVSGVLTSSTNTRLIIPLPSVSISAPKGTNANTLTVTGTATIPGGGPTGVPYADKVTNVMFEVSNALSGAILGTWSNAFPEGTNSTGTNNWSKWSATVTLGAGSNTITAYGMDVLGNIGTNKSAVVFYTTTNTLELLTNGYGTITNSAKTNFLVAGPNALVVGTNYTVRAVPNPDNLFSNWTVVFGSNTVTVTNNPLTFLMESNMTVTANFVTNEFIGVAGSYTGLFYVTNTNGLFAGVNEGLFEVSNGVGALSSGLLENLLVKTNGAYTASLHTGGSNYSISGNFSLAGTATNQITRAAKLGSLTLAMTLNWNITPPQVTGTVSNNNRGGWTASLLAELAGANQPSAEYALLIPPANNAPAGFGSVEITNRLGGTAIVTGQLADGTTFSESVAISGTGNLPVYAAPYTNGLVLGLLSLTNGYSPMATPTPWP